MAVFLFGTGLALGQIWGLVVVPVFVVLVQEIWIRKEEATLKQTFGDAYTHYCQHVRRWL